jgi:hypothetical protein
MQRNLQIAEIDILLKQKERMEIVLAFGQIQTSEQKAALEDAKMMLRKVNNLLSIVGVC